MAPGAMSGEGEGVQRFFYHRGIAPLLWALVS